MPKTWHAEILESNAIVEGVPPDLVYALNRLQAAGWTIVQLLPNGVNRWTIICQRGTS